MTPSGKPSRDIDIDASTTIVDHKTGAEKRFMVAMRGTSESIYQGSVV